MTSEDYIKIAGALAEARGQADRLESADYQAVRIVDLAAREIAAVLEDDDPRFDREQFFAAVTSPETST